MTTLIEIPKNVEEFRIRKIFIRGERYDENNPTRLNLYRVSEQGLPAEEILKTQVILRKENFEQGIISVDISDQNIVLKNESFFVGIQRIGTSKVNWPAPPEIIQTLQVGKTLSYYRESSFKGNAWYSNNFKFYKVYFEYKVPVVIGTLKGNPLNMCASAEIECFPDKFKIEF